MMWSPVPPFPLLRRILVWALLTREDAVLGAPKNEFSSINPSMSLQWKPCFSTVDKAPFRSVECARLIVPLDYSNASGGESQLAIIRLRAPKKSSVGDADWPVFFNPGGPGGDPVKEFMSGTAGNVWAKYAPGSDIIGIVPRAIGSTFPPAGCYRNQTSRTARLRELAFNNELGYVNASVNIMEANAVAFGLDCANTSADTLPHMSTVNTARDMNYVLKALGREKLKFVGFSYGTVLGATFAALFPDKVERMVLDGVQDGNNWFANVAAPDRAIGDVDIALDSFFTSCFAAGPDACQIWCSGGSSEIRSYFFEADRRIQQTPINVPQVGLFEFTQWRYAVYGALYQPSLLFRNLAKLVSEVYEGKAGDAIAGILQAQAKSGLPIDPPLIDEKTQLSNGIESLWTIKCLDHGQIQTAAKVQDARHLFENFRNVSEVGRNNAYYEIICNNFPVKSKATLPGKLDWGGNKYGVLQLRVAHNVGRFDNIRTSKPILFVGNTADPTTPLRNAVSMAHAFPGSAVLVINGTGHTSMFADPSFGCALQWIVPYITNGELPLNGTVCQAAGRPFDD